MMNRSFTTKPNSRHGISLLEVLISIGVIALGIFGVVALIPAAQTKIQQGLDAEREATMGQRAVAEFRIRNMGSPGTRAEPNWLPVRNADLALLISSDEHVATNGICLDPLGIAFGLTNGSSNANLDRFPTRTVSSLFSGAQNADYMLMPRVTLNVGFSRPMPLSVANDIFLLQDDLVFQRPDDVSMQPRRQYFVSGQNRAKYPVKSMSEGSMSWFATITPDVKTYVSPSKQWDNQRDKLSTPLLKKTDEFLLSIVIVKNRIPLPSPTEEGIAVVLPYQPGQPNRPTFAGEITLDDSVLGDPSNDDRMRVDDLRIGDWLLLTKESEAGMSQSGEGFEGGGYRKVGYRWTRIVGADDREAKEGTTRTFSIANDDFFSSGQSLKMHAVFMRDVMAVYERSIRLDNSSAWDTDPVIQLAPLGR